MITDLGALPGDSFSQAGAINSRGQVVGQSFPSGVFLWENGSLIDLNAFVPRGSGVQLAEALAINDRGEITGLDLPPNCINDTQCGHAFVLIPCGEDPPDTEGCQDAAESATAAIKYSLTPLSQSPVDAVEGGLKPGGIAPWIRARLGRNSDLRAWSRK